MFCGVPNVGALFCTLLNDVDVLVVPKMEPVPLVVVPNPPRLFPKVAALPNTDVVLLDFPNIDVLPEEVNPPPPNGLLLCTPNVVLPNTLLVDVLLTRFN